MSEALEEREAVRVVVLSQALKRYETKLDQLKKEGVEDTQLETVVKNLKKLVEDE